VASALKGRDRAVALFEMREVRGTFELTREELDVDELAAYYPRRARTISEEFEALSDPTLD